jgi:hypothetical protein
MLDTAKENNEAKRRTTEERQADEIAELRQLLSQAYRRQDELQLEKLTIWKVIQRGKYDEQLQIVETNTTPQGIVIIVC